MIEYLFCDKCSKMLSYISASIFDHNVDSKELLSELFLYLAKDNWSKLRQFEFRSSLMTWLSVVSIRFFQKKRGLMIESDNSAVQLLDNRIINRQSTNSDAYLDVHNAINNIKNPRYRDVIIALDIEGYTVEEYAQKIGITIANLYNLHRRALVHLRTIMEKEDYYG